MTGEFGQPETIYDGPRSLIVAVHAHPGRFSPETHALVKQLINDELLSANHPGQDPTLQTTAN
jgi:hypothetical protein